ncbi:hypothetical protein C1646_775479 [Rhizophagus diaphanus]|nr:hypothetical protein C1646_775479 [Rhizophagus diaphanus] [Rhizophagus sp. MUCL 43196]
MKEPRFVKLGGLLCSEEWEKTKIRKSGRLPCSDGWKKLRFVYLGFFYYYANMTPLGFGVAIDQYLGMNQHVGGRQLNMKPDFKILILSALGLGYADMKRFN